MKIFRLSMFNLKKNKREAAAIVFLTLVSSFLLGVFLSSVINIDKTFDRCYAETGSVNNAVSINSGKYRDVYRDILENNYGINDIRRGKSLYQTGAMIDRGEKRESYNLRFVTENTELMIEDFIKYDSLPDEKLITLSHPIWLPEIFDIGSGFKTGDIFDVVAGGRHYPFEIAGFYKCGIYADTGQGAKCVISDYDYMLLSAVYTEFDLLLFNSDGEFDYPGYYEKCYEMTSEDSYKAIDFQTEYEVKENQTTFLKIMLYICLFVAAVTIAASMFLIGHKITKDIEDQMQQIGVLEALGYRSAEISLSYVCEYILSAGIGAVAGALFAVLFTPVLDSMFTGVTNRVFDSRPDMFRITASALAVALLAVLFALVKAGVINRIPPVTAFRKGIATHHFGRNVFPLEKLKKSINLRLAMKGIFTDLGSNIGAAVCIILAGTAIMFSIFTFDFFSAGYMAIVKIAGMEFSDESITLMNGVDPAEFREELLKLPEVRKVNITFEMGMGKWLKIKDSEEKGSALVYEDYNETENIKVSEGRFPEYDNEMMISLARAEKENRSVGDSLIMIGDGGEKSYIITGIVPGTSNSRMNLYFTTDGYIRLNPNARPNVLNVHLYEGTDRRAFEQKITGLYGANVKDTAYSGEGTGTLEERIRAAADDKMATLISHYGVTDVDYAIKIGDTMIKGNSSKFIIKEMTSDIEEGETEIRSIAEVTSVFCVICVIFVGVVVAVILGIISVTTVKRQRKELGIMKSMGYSSRDLMIQIALRILPTAIISSVISAVCAIYVQRAFWLAVFGVIIPEKLPLMIGTGTAIVMFCLIVSYISAGKIRKISVTELMTE